MIDLNDRPKLERAILGALTLMINDHGPITHKNKTSAVKRVIGAIKTYNRNEREAQD